MIWVTSLNDREAILKTYNIRLMVSLVSPDAELPDVNLPLDDHLILRFHDIAEPRPGLTAMSTAMLEQLLAFNKRYAEQTKLIHCFAGISRSTAAAYCLKASDAPAGTEVALAEKLRILSPAATPNPRIIALADQLLERGGLMVEAIKAIGRGRNAFSGKPFCWP